MKRSSTTSDIVILSGLSGAGKTSALHVLEDAGYFAIDNLPVELFPNLLDLFLHPSSRKHQYRRLALVMDARGGEFHHHFSKYRTLLKKKPIRLRILFFDARDEVIIRRFSVTRRRHPLSPAGRVLSGIVRERQLLRGLRGLATHVVDSSALSVHDLRKTVLHLLKIPASPLSVNVLSFGYHFGLPPESDLVIDVRFLPNPFFVPNLRPLTGNHPKIKRYLFRSRETKRFLALLQRNLAFLLKNYHLEGKAHLTIAFGCTGGRHRSVLIANQIGSYLKRLKYRATIRHRDVARSE